MGQPVTWDQIIDAAAQNGKVAVQANKYEGYVVWINARISGAGGELATDTEKGLDMKLGSAPTPARPRRRSSKLAHSAAAPPPTLGRPGGQAGATFGGPQGVHGQLDLHLQQLRRHGPRVQQGHRFTRYPQTVEGGTPARRTAASGSA